MRRYTIACCLAVAVVLTLAAPARAQNAPKGDLALSYSVLYDKELPNDIPEASGWFPTGWVASGAARVTGNLSLVGEIGANYQPLTYQGLDVTINVTSYLGGVRYTAKAGPKVLPFVQVLFGLARANATVMGVSASDDAFATQIGGGADVMVSRTLAVRLQGDYRAIRAHGSAGNEFRVATGIVYHF